ncbi:MAG: tripartite tricarboxylate transporter TctB family protein [Geminicoccaceae bacterium]
MSRRVQENVVAAVLLLLFAGVLIMSFDYGPRARLVPVPIAIIGIVLTLAQLVWQNLRGADDLHVDVLELVAGRDSSNKRKTAQREALQREGGNASGQYTFAAQVKAFAIVGVLLALFLVLGPVPAIFLFSAGYFMLTGESWFRGLLYAFLCAGSLYLVFGYILQVQLNRGLAAPLIGQYLDF